MGPNPTDVGGDIPRTVGRTARPVWIDSRATVRRPRQHRGAGEASTRSRPHAPRAARSRLRLRTTCHHHKVQPEAAPREALYIPDRFEGLTEAGSGALQTIVVPVPDSLAIVDARFLEMRASRRGSLMVLRGESGAGKSTFLDTVGLFRRGVATERIGSDAHTSAAFDALGPASGPRIVVMEGREALGEVSAATIEATMHSINSFIRSSNGRDTLVVWPTNTNDLTDLLLTLGRQLGGGALVGAGQNSVRFNGPTQGEFVGIAERTVAALNEGASLAALGISQERAEELAKTVDTVGQYLAVVRQTLLENGAKVRALLVAEQYRLWVLVIAGTDTEGDVAALTRGGYAYADIDRLMTSTKANIVASLRRQPDQVGILGTVLDSKILNIDMVTVTAVARQYGDDELHRLMRAAGMSTSADTSASERLAGSELGLILAGQSLGTRKRGSKPGPGTKEAFEKLAEIARNNDGALNRAIGRGLEDLGLIEDYEAERELGTELKFYSDLYCVQFGSPFRIEAMWRSRTGRAEIANYTLGKLGNYGRAIGLLGTH